MFDIDISTIRCRKNVKLGVLNEKILNTLSEKEVLLKEIHHRVKNNLQLVISLLNIQARQSDNVSINEFIEKGESRIFTMALIHENLYQTNDLNKVNYQKYLDTFIQNTKVIYNKSDLLKIQQIPKIKDLIDQFNLENNIN